MESCSGGNDLKNAKMQKPDVICMKEDGHTPTEQDSTTFQNTIDTQGRPEGTQPKRCRWESISKTRKIIWTKPHAIKVMYYLTQGLNSLLSRNYISIIIFPLLLNLISDSFQVLEGWFLLLDVVLKWNGWELRKSDSILEDCGGGGG